MTIQIAIKTGLAPLKRLAQIMVSNVDKKAVDGEHAVRLCNYLDVYRHDAITDELPFMDATASTDQIARFSLHAGDVLITKDSETPEDIAISAYVPRDLPGVVCGYHLAILRPHGPDIDGRYLHWAISSTVVSEQFHAFALGITRFGLRQSAIGAIQVPIAPVARQRLIAEYLDRETALIDSLIEKKRRLLELFSQRTRSRIADLMDGLALQDGDDLPLRAVLQPRQVVGLPDLEVLSVFREYGVVPKSSREGNYNKTPDDLSRYQLVEVGDLVINKMKAWQGSLGVSAHRGIVSPDYLVCEVMYAVDPEFLHSFLRSPQMIARYTERSTGIRPAQWRLYWEDLKQVWIRLPDQGTQQRLGAAMRDARVAELQAMEIAGRQIALLQERRQAVVTAAITGELDIRESA